MISKGLDMMGVKIAAPVITTMPTGEAVARINIVSPSLIFKRVALTEPFSGQAVDVARSIFSARCRPSTKFCADLRASLWRVRFPKHRSRGIGLLGRRHFRFGFFGMAAAAESARTALNASPRVGLSVTRGTPCRQPIDTTSISREVGHCSPYFALGASLHAGADATIVLSNAYSCASRRPLYRAFGVSSHDRR